MNKLAAGDSNVRNSHESFDVMFSAGQQRTTIDAGMVQVVQLKQNLWNEKCFQLSPKFFLESLVVLRTC